MLTPKLPQADLPRLNLQVETLEQRMMLSTVEVFAAGSEFDLSVNGEIVATFDPVQEPSSIFGFDGLTDRLVYETEETIDPSQIAIDFKVGGPSIGRGTSPRSLFVDKIIVDGETFEAEAQDTRYTNDRLGISGFAQREAIYASQGKFQFAQDNSNQPLGTRIRIDALGETGDENLQLQVNGELVENFSFDSANEYQTFFYSTDEIVNIDDLQIRFTNDLYEPDKNVDRNLVVKSFQAIDVVSGTRAIARPQADTVTRSDQSEPSNKLGVFSTGTYNEIDGVTPGFGRGQTLSTNGIMEVLSKETVRIRVDAFGDTGDEQFEVYLGGKLQGTFDVTQDLESYFVTVPNFGVQNGFGTGAGENLIIKFINDSFDPVTEADNNLTVDSYQLIYPEQGRRLIYNPSDDNVFSTGTFADGEIVNGFGRGNTLHVDGYFQATTPSRLILS